MNMVKFERKNQSNIVKTKKKTFTIIKYLKTCVKLSPF